MIQHNTTQQSLLLFIGNFHREILKTIEHDSNRSKKNQFEEMVCEK